MRDPLEPTRHRSRGGPKRARASTLEAFLDGPTRPAGALSYHEAQGFLFTVAAAPEVVPPSDWIPVVMGGEEPELGTRAKARRILDELVRLYNRFVHEMSAGEVRLPRDCRFRDDLLANLSEDAPIRQWSRGFLNGHGWLMDCWDLPRPDEMDKELTAVFMTLSFFSSRELAERVLAESSGTMSLVEAAELSRRVFEPAMASYAAMGEALRRALVTGPSPTGPRVGRNEPCPCGSGKKYKRCCESVPADPTEQASRRVRRIQEEIEPKVVRFLQTLCGPDGVGQGRDEFACGYDEVERDGPEDTLFEPWLLYDWIPDVPEQRDRSDRGSVARLFLDRHGARLTPDEFAYLEATTATPNGLHEVLEVDPGRRLRLRDLLLEVEHEVFERSASMSVRIGDMLYGRVVAFDGVTLIVGMGEVALPPQDKLGAIKIRNRLRGDFGPPAPVMIRAVDRELRSFYLGLRDRLMNPRPPVVTNTDGEPIELHRISCDVESTDDAFAALASLATGRSKVDLLKDAQLDDDGRLIRVEIPWIKRGGKQRGPIEKPVLGHLVLEGTRLEAEVNSAGRARRLQRSLRKRLGSSMRNLTVAITPIAEALAELEEKRGTAEERDRKAEDAALSSRPEVREAMRQFRERRWEAWVDEPIPALDGRTPREAVKQTDGREQVEALLSQFERHDEHEDPDDAYDFNRVRRMLGMKSR